MEFQRAAKAALATIICLALAPLQAAAQANSQDEPYDVLFIAVDDLNDWVGFIGGHPQTKTPNIDQLAARGMAFTNAQSPSALCNPVRTALLSGMRPSTTGIYGNAPDWREQDIFQGKPTLPRFFQDNGYATLGAGKIFHAHTFFENGLSGFNDTTAWNAFYPGLNRQLPDELGPITKPDNGNDAFTGFDWFPLVAEDYALGDGQVVSWVEQQILDPADQARFIAAGIYRPHLPWYVPQSYFDLHPLDSIELPPHKRNDLNDVPPIAVSSDTRSVEAHNWIVDSGSWEEGVQAYLASISYADAMVGRLLDALDASGRADRTIIVLWGDHGFHLGEKGRWRKMTLWNESTHVPMIIVAPGVTTPGTSTGAPVSLMDIYPTLSELAGLDTPAHVEGRSLVPLLEDSTRDWDYPALSTYGFGNHSVVSERYRYIRYVDGSEELYDHLVDPNEWTNVADVARFADVAAELRTYLPDENAPDLAQRQNQD